MSGKTDHFIRLNALVDNGWLGILKGSEIALWLAYEKFADPAGESYPGSDRLARCLGHSTDSHISPIRKSLADYGLIEVLEWGGGRGKTARVRVLIPPQISLFQKPNKPSRIGGGLELSKPSQNGGVLVSKPSQSGALNPPNPADKPSQSGARNKEEQPIEQPIEQQLPAGKPQEPDEVIQKSTVPAPRKRPAAGRKLTDEQNAVRAEFTHWYTDIAFPAKNHGVVYEFNGRDGGAVMLILRSRFVAWDLERAKALASVFLNEPDLYIRNQGWKLYELANKITRFAPKAQRLLHERFGHANTGIVSTNGVDTSGGIREFGVEPAGT